jgi:hypothetical protein
LPSVALAAARISATDIFFFSAIESLGGTGLDQPFPEPVADRG